MLFANFCIPFGRKTPEFLQVVTKVYTNQENAHKLGFAGVSTTSVSS
jgi:hypothetical protein